MLQSCSYTTWSTVVLSISTQSLIFQWDKKIKYHYSHIQLYALFPQFLNCICTSSGAWQSVWCTYSALFLLIFVLSRLFKTGYIYSDYFPRICWRVICTTPSATWGGGREMSVSNENFKKTSICISGFVFFFNCFVLSEWGRQSGVLTKTHGEHFCNWTQNTSVLI